MSIRKKIGFLGGGQLGRMTYQAALNLGIHLYHMDPAPDAPCKHASHQFTVGDINDYDQVLAFGQDKDVISIEIEKVNCDALEELERMGKKVFPQPHIIRLIQDKRTQKQFFKEHGIPTAEYVLTESKQDLQQYQDWFPAVHKLGRDGYDGKGVQIIKSVADIEKGFDAPSLLERKVDISKEISVIVARNASGQVKTFPVAEQVFDPQLNLLDYLMVPSDLSAEKQQKAKTLAVDLVEQLGFVGILAVELFVDTDGKIWVNELAPRTHNSGHHTIEANYTSQFEQHLRSILDLPLGDTELRAQAAMINLIGEPGHTGPAYYAGLDQILACQGIYPHLYGKTQTKPGRKMGHVTVLANTYDELLARIELVKTAIKVQTTEATSQS